MLDLLNEFIIGFLKKAIDFMPNLFSGIIIIAFGLMLAALLKKILLSLLKFLRIDDLLEKTRLMKKKEVIIWEEVIIEILRWTIIILFLIPALEVWNLSRVTTVINQLLLYLPNVIVAVVIAFIGLIASNLGYDLIKHSVKTIGATSATTLATMTKWLIVFFTILVVMNQLGVAQDLIRILFTGIVLMLAIAGGLAFGLGGKEIAKEMLEELRNKFK